MATDDTLARSIGERLKTARVQRCMSLQALASGLGVTYQQVRKYETGQNRISASTLFKVAGLLGVEISYFFEGLVATRAVPAKAPVADAELAHALGRIEDDATRRQMAALIVAIEQLNRRK